MSALAALPAPITVPGQRTPAMSLDDFVRQTRTTVSDVALSASAGLHRVELALDGRPRFTVTVPSEPAIDAAAEAQALARLSRGLVPAVARTVPTCVDVVEVGGRRCSVLTALAGEVLKPITIPSSHDWNPTVDEHFRWVLAWLEQLWACTRSSEPAPVDRTLAPRLAARLGADARWPRAAAMVTAASERLEAEPVLATAVHGALSPHALRLGGGGVTGVGDWSQSHLLGDPRTDVARFIVAYAPDHVGTALQARTRYAAAVRGFVTGALGRLGADPGTWRDTVVVGLAAAAAGAEPRLAGEAALELWSLSGATSRNGSLLRGRSSA